MALQVIGAGLGRTGTLSLKVALEQLGFAKCHHMIEILADAGRLLPLWEEAVAGRPDWHAIFDGYAATTDFPACMYWREIADHFPDAKIVLSVRDADSWFDSVNKTIMSPPHVAYFDRTAMAPMLNQGVYEAIGKDRLSDREYMTRYFREWNQSVIGSAPPERLLVYDVKQGWEPLCAFLGVPVPDAPFPRVNSSEEMKGGLEFGDPPSIDGLEEVGRAMLRNCGAI